MSNDDNVELTDGFHVLIDALKMNDIDTMYGVVGIPITNLARMWQDDGQRFTASVTNNTQVMQLLSPVTSKENLAFA